MNDTTHAFWQSYARQLADLLGLRDWVIEVLRDVPGSRDCWAEVHCTHGMYSAVIRFDATWPATNTLEEQREIMVHELLHCHTNEIQERVRFVADRFGDNSLVSALPDLTRHEIERATDALSRIIAPHMPLPIQYAAFQENGIPHYPGFHDIARREGGLLTPINTGELTAKGD